MKFCHSALQFLSLARPVLRKQRDEGELRKQPLFYQRRFPFFSSAVEQLICSIYFCGKGPLEVVSYLLESRILHTLKLA